MRATVIHAPRDIRSETLPDPVVRAPHEAVVRVLAACVCGSDLWPYRGENPVDEPHGIGHEHVGVVEEVGADVRAVSVGDVVVAPFTWSCGRCAHCLAGVHTSCVVGGVFGGEHGAQAELVRVPQADGTLVVVPGHDAASPPDGDLLRDLLACSDVMGTGWHAARSAGVREGSTVVVVGDGAVGLCGVLSAVQQGAARVVVMSRHADRQALAVRFGATDVVAERGEDGEQAVLGLTDGVGADAVLECVGTEGSMTTAFAVARPGATVGFVGVPHGATPPVRRMFRHNVGLAGGIAPVRAYLPDLLHRVLAGSISPGAVFDRELPLAEAAQAYDLMDRREAVKVLLRP
ncbi:alcohol dehydrogenase catalytic domain-containing protein [Aquipuribacter hungaricus]|uniref:Alcohol dehydrogenase catalytic domain-containing protein n=1 Tax=Aquipuribacter hungaricus TaxID=545624 RepID=A0ABV7WLL5_9MICO